jgi:hypothetical protein
MQNLLSSMLNIYHIQDKQNKLEHRSHTPHFQAHYATKTATFNAENIYDKYYSEAICH